MGGRGSTSGLTNQINIQDITNKEKINNIKIMSEELRQGDTTIEGVSKGSELKQCNCCESYSVPINSLNYECKICGWIDNKHQNNNIDSLDGPNKMTLREAKDRWSLKNR